MSKRANAVTFKGEGKTLVGPELKVGDKAPDFKTIQAPFTVVTLADTPSKPRLFSVVPSLDTGVCSKQTHHFDESLAAMKDQVVAYTVSLDLPFAQKRFCTDPATPINNLLTISDVHNHSFGENYGVLLEGLPFPLLTRAVFVVDSSNTITYVEYVPEVTSEPNYEAALAALKAAK
jgi:thioredoxin-dependent peroxiredoxin